MFAIWMTHYIWEKPT